MCRRSKVLAHAVLLAALGIALLIPTLASAGPDSPPCTIDGPKIVSCQATLCGPVGNYTYAWRDKDGAVGSTRCITITRGGTYTLVVIDPATGNKSQCSHTLKMDKCRNNPPDCSGARAKDDLLWPPNHEMQAVEIEGVTDPDGDPILITVYAITQDEPLNVEGDGNTCADAEIVDGVASVRRERTGDPNIPGNGRVYTVYFTASDGKQECTGSVTLCVPHDMGQRDTCIDDGQIYDSLGTCPEGP